MVSEKEKFDFDGFVSDVMNNKSRFLYDPILYMIECSGMYDSFVFPVNAQGKIRTTQGDKRWKTNIGRNDKYGKRADRLSRYYSYTDALRKLMLRNRYMMENDCIIIVNIKLPDSYYTKVGRVPSKKGRELLASGMHKVKPDWDNIAKGFQDSLSKEDSHVYHGTVYKRWVESNPSIVAYKIKDYAKDRSF